MELGFAGLVGSSVSTLTRKRSLLRMLHVMGREGEDSLTVRMPVRGGGLKHASRLSSGSEEARNMFELPGGDPGRLRFGLPFKSPFALTGAPRAMLHLGSGGAFTRGAAPRRAAARFSERYCCIWGVARPLVSRTLIHLPLPQRCMSGSELMGEVSAGALALTARLKDVLAVRSFHWKPSRSSLLARKSRFGTHCVAADVHSQTSANTSTESLPQTGLIRREFSASRHVQQ